MRPDHKRVAVAALRRGELTISEVAQLLGVTKSAVSRWCSFDIELARRRHMVRVWRRAIGTKRERKADQRREAEIADHLLGGT